MTGYVQHPVFGRCLGLCDTDRCQILISDVPPPAKRMKVFAHELAHAVRAECDPDQSGGLPGVGRLIDEEKHCELASMGTLLPAELLARVEVYLRTGVEPQGFICLGRQMIPVFGGSVPPAI